MNIAFEVFLRNPEMSGKLTFEENILLGELLNMVRTRLEPLAAEINEEESMVSAATIIHQDSQGFKLSFNNYSLPLQEKMMASFTQEDFVKVQQATIQKIMELEN